MNAQMKKRLVIVTGIIVIVLVLLLAIVGGGTSAKTIALADAAGGTYANQRVQVTGNVVKDSYSTSGNVLSFSIYDPEHVNAGQLRVDYDGAAASTFGNDVTAICTGKMGEDGVLRASELVTKCPSKYESGTEALEVSRLLDYGAEVNGTTVRVKGTVAAGSQNPAGSGARFALADASDPAKTVSVLFDGAVSEETLADGATVVVTGDMLASGEFSAIDVALQG